MTYTEREVTALLKERNVLVEAWGHGAAKTVGELAEEMRKGECKVDLDTLERHIQTTVLDVRHKDFRLVEVMQIFDGWRKRERKLPWGSVGEKMFVEEDPLDAVVRALWEELKIACDESLSVEPVGKEKLISPSGSYPGLMTHNTQYRFRVELSEKFYKPKGYMEFQENKTTLFGWGQVKKKE